MEIIKEFNLIGHRIKSMLVKSKEKHENNHIGVLIMHSDMSYLDFEPGEYIAKRGFTVLLGDVRNPDGLQDTKMLDVKACIEYLRNVESVDKIVILGHSGGATLMSAYQAIAENGVGIFQNEHMVISHRDIGELPEADGIMLLDSNLGNGTMTLLSIDPSVNEDGSCSEDLNLFNQLKEHPEGLTYDEEFKRKFLHSQGQRNNAIIHKAQERLKAIEEGKSTYLDDEPLIIQGASQIKPCNKMINEDIHLMSHTKGIYPLLHADGSITHEVIKCLRKPWISQKNPTKYYNMGTISTTVKAYLSSRAVLVNENYNYDDCTLTGVDFDSSYCTTCGNVKHIHSPILIMGMTASYEYFASEIIYSNCPSDDKTICFSKNIGHMLLGEDEAMNNSMYDYIGKWLTDHFGGK